MPKNQIDKPEAIRIILEVLNEIDTTIMDINAKSSKDYLELMSHQKSLFGSLRTLSDKVGKINKLSTLEENSFLDVYDSEYYKKFTEGTSGLLQDFSTLKNQNDTFSSQLAYCNVVLRNLNQTLTTLKLIEVSSKVSTSINGDPVTLVNEEQRGVFDELVNEIEKYIFQFSENQVEISENADNSRHKLVSVVQKTESLISTANAGLISLINYAGQNRGAFQKLKTLNEELKQGLSGTRNITVDIQYQDIVRQKLEHVQQFIKDMSKSIDNTDETRFHEYMSQIAIISTIQIGQIVKIDEEFNTSISNILKRFNQSTSRILSLFGCQNLELRENNLVKYYSERYLKILSELDTAIVNTVKESRNLEKLHEVVLNVVGVVRKKSVLLIDQLALNSTDEKENNTQETRDSRLRSYVQYIVEKGMQINEDLIKVEERLKNTTKEYVQEIDKISELYVNKDLLKNNQGIDQLFSKAAIGDLSILKSIGQNEKDVEDHVLKFKKQIDKNFNHFGFYKDRINDLIEKFEKIQNIIYKLGIKPSEHLPDHDKVRMKYTITSEKEVLKNFYKINTEEKEKKDLNNKENGNFELF